MPLEPKQEPPYYEIVDEAGAGTTYIALMNQAGTNAPTPTILRNTLGTITWTYSNFGIYIGTKTGAFPAAKTKVSLDNNINQLPDEDWNQAYAYRANDNEIVIITGQPNAGGVNSILVNCGLTIQIYP